MAKATTTVKKKKKELTPGSGIVHIQAGFNNTIISISDEGGNILFSGSAGRSGFKGSRKSTPYAATKSAESVAQEAYSAGMSEVAVYVKGPGMGRVSAIKALKTAGLRVTSIADITPIPHNGCRPKKKRRI